MGGCPTFKYTRIEVAAVFDRLAAGEPLKHIVKGFQERVSQAAIEETLMFLAKAWAAQTERMRAEIG